MEKHKLLNIFLISLPQSYIAYSTIYEDFNKSDEVYKELWQHHKE